MTSANKQILLYNTIELQTVKSILIEVFEGGPDLTKTTPRLQNYLSSRQSKGVLDKIISF
jgi:hypothetical protein